MLKLSPVAWLACVSALSASGMLTDAFAQSAPPQAVKWDLQVMSDGQQIDAFDGTTNVGQAKTDTHHHVIKNNVGCADKPAGDIDLSRTLTVSPLHANATDVTLQIDAQETLQSDASTTTAAGCKIPPQPRQVTATHPGLMLKPGEWTTWTIVDKNPQIIYKVRATLATAAAG